MVIQYSKRLRGARRTRAIERNLAARVAALGPLAVGLVADAVFHHLVEVFHESALGAEFKRIHLAEGFEHDLLNEVARLGFPPELLAQADAHGGQHPRLVALAERFLAI